ncbi:TPA: hypothetical protein ACGRP0_004150 [Stenotrophomonas maltophilia]|jgi:hypothetical protein
MSTPRYALTVKEVVWIEQVLSNDEDSSDEEILAYFVTNGLTLDQATSVMAHRDDCRCNTHFAGQGPLFE